MVSGTGAQPRPQERVLMPQIRPPSVRGFPWYKEACAQRADAVNMQRSALVAVLLVVLAGWGIAALMAITPVLRVGSLSILII